MFQHYTVNENIINDYTFGCILNNTNNEYTLQGVYNANSYIGVITSLQDVYLAIYDINAQPFV